MTKLIHMKMSKQVTEMVHELYTNVLTKLPKIMVPIIEFIIHNHLWTLKNCSQNLKIIYLFIYLFITIYGQKGQTIICKGVWNPI